MIAEGCAIVVSILLAFSIDAWWDSARERDHERTVLVGLQEEFTTNSERLASTLVDHRATAESAAALLRVADQNLDVPADSLSDLLWAVFLDARSYNPSGGVLEGLIVSGDLGIIRDEELRGLLASWPGLVDESAEDEDWVFRNVREVYTPYLNRVIPTRAIWSEGSALAGPVPAEVEASYATILRDPEFADLVSMRAYGARTLVAEAEVLEDLISRVLELIGVQLE